MNSKGHYFDSQDYDEDFPTLTNNSHQKVKKKTNSQSQEKRQAVEIESKPLPLVGGIKEQTKIQIAKDIKQINAENGTAIAGCKNQYNDCFVNSLANALANTTFRQHVMNIDTRDRHNMPVTRSLKFIFQQMELGYQNISTRHLRYNIEQYRDKTQHDICFFYQDLLSKLIEEETPQNIEVQNENETKPK